jgi:hypothetical protein
VFDKTTKTLSKPVPFKIRVESYNNSVAAPRCPKNMNSTACLPWIESVSNEGIAEIRFPYDLRETKENITKS